MTIFDVFKILFIDFKVITIPLLNIIAVMVLKAASLPGKIDGDKFKELLHFGIDLAHSGLLYIVTSVCYQLQQALTQPPSTTSLEDTILIQNFLILVYILTTFTFSLILRNCAYDSTDKITTKWIAISDIVGVGMLLFAIWFIG